MSIGRLVEQRTGETYPLSFEPLTIGRGVDNTVVLADPLVSRHHAEIVLQGTKWVVRDLGSANGTFVNGQRIAGPWLLSSGDTIGVGPALFRVELAGRLGDQDTLVTRRPLAEAPSGYLRPRLAAPAIVLALVAIVAAVLFGVLVVLPRLREGRPPAEAPSGYLRSRLAAPAIVLALVAIVAAVLFGVLVVLPRLREGRPPAGPGVTILAPADNTRVEVGSPVQIQAQATDPKGVTQAQIVVDGTPVQQVPGQGNPTTLLINATWTFEQAGQHTLTITAQNAAGAQGAPATVRLLAVEEAAQVTATPPPARPTATALPTRAPPTPESPAPPVAVSPTATAPQAPPPTIGYFRAGQTTIERGQCTRLQWGQVSGATSITLSGVGRVNASGQLDVCLDTTRTYTLRATGRGGAVEKKVEIVVQPPAGPVIEYFRAVPSILAPGDCTQLEWGKVDNATAAAIQPDIGGVATPGSQKVCPGSTTTYLLIAENATGKTTAQVTVIVASGSEPKPVIAFFTASPASIQAGECTTLSWGKVDYATEVTINHNIGGVATPGSREVCLGETTAYLMTAIGPGGVTEYKLTVHVLPGRPANLPDLVIESVLFEPNPCYRGQTCQVRIKVRNDGAADAGRFVLRWSPEGEEVVPVEWDVDSLAAGQEKTLSYPWLPARAAGDWKTIATVDARDEVEEIEEGAANTLEQVITVLGR